MPSRLPISRLSAATAPLLRRGTLLLATAAGLLAAAGAQAQAPQGTRPIENRATVSYRDADGSEGSAEAVATILVQMAAPVRVTPDQRFQVMPGARQVVAHTVTNEGEWATPLRLDASGPARWQLAIYRDLNGNGVLDADDLPLADEFTLQGGESWPVLLVVSVPAEQIDVEGAVVELRASSTIDPAATSAAQDLFTVVAATPGLALQKAVDRAVADVGDTLTYTLSFAVFEAPAREAVLVDALPRGVRFLPGTFVVTGVPAGEAQLTVTPSDGAETLSLPLGHLASGAAATASFRAVVLAGAPDVLRNEWALRHAGGEARSNAVDTRLTAAQLTLVKQYLGGAEVQVGAEVQYRIRWTNPTGRAVAGATLVDTLPAALEYVAAEGAPMVTGRVVTWSLGTIEPRATGSVVLTVRIASRPADGRILNTAAVSGEGASAEAAAGAFVVAERPSAILRIAKTAGVLEASLGERIAYRVALTNTGRTAAADVVVRDRLPAGVRLVSDRAAGADSLRVAGRDLTLWLGTVAAGAERVVEYAVAITEAPSGGTLDNVATAEGISDGVPVRSDTAIASVRARSGFALEARTLVGKVWFDADGDGRQGAGEFGVGGIEVMSSDGQIVTTDYEGRFSFANLRAGTHVLRLDVHGLPGGMGLAARGDDAVRVRMDGWTTPAVSFRLVTVAAPAMAAAADTTAAEVLAPRVAPARTSEERAEEEAASFTTGPTVRLTAPMDGAIIGTNRAYVGVQGEAGAAIRLYRGDTLLTETSLRPDGTADFVGVELAPGRNVFRVAMAGSWGTERWDSLAVHRAGAPTRLEAVDGHVTVQADGRVPAVARVRATDAWGVPVGGAVLTVEAEGARIVASDADASSVGVQVRTEADGTARIELRGGREVGAGTLRLTAGRVKGTVPVRIVPADRPLMVTGAGQLGFGAAADDFAAASVRGSVGRETAVTLSLDTRRAAGEEDFFRRGQDLLDEGRYPTLGDAGQVRSLAAAQQALSLRVERGLDWIELGDVQTTDFGAGAGLSSYRRSLTGVAGRVATGAVTWRGFGSMTDQVLTQQQLRADGSSGPYRFGVDARPGTERVRIEVRARENAARVLTQQELVYGVDYQIEYATGTVLLQRPVPATDGDGNPVFVVATLERRTGGDRRMVAGLGGELDVVALSATRAVDSLAVSLGAVHDAGAGLGAGAGVNMLSSGVRVQSGAVAAAAELLRSESADSAAFAGRAELRLDADRARLGASWMRVGAGFDASADPRLRGGVEEIRGSVAVDVAKNTELRVAHERQRFAAYDVARDRTSLQAVQKVGGRAMTAEAALVNDEQAGVARASSAGGKLTVAATPEMDVWVETTQALRIARGPDSVVARPLQDHVGGGITYRIRPGLRLEASHRQVQGDSAAQGITAVNLRTERVLGGAAWTGIERAGGMGAAHSAVLGWSPRLALTGGWTAHAMLERRIGLDRVAVADPVRALPFTQPERDRWTLASGVEYLAADSTAPRVSARGEWHGGAEQRGYRFDVAGEAPVGGSLALITRHDWTLSERIGQGAAAQRRERSIVGMAYRPVEHDEVNLLGKLEWRRDAGPMAGAPLAQLGDQARLIGAGDAVWTPHARTELAARYAVRRSWTIGGPAAAFAPGGTAQYVGGRVEQGIVGPLGARVDGRMLLTRGAGATWSVAPSLLADLGRGLTIEAGHRIGGLQDRDFGGGSGGLFATLGFRFTEGTAGRIADYWKGRQ